MNPIRRLELANVVIAEDVRAARRLIQAAENIHERALARTARAHNGGEFTFGEFEVDRTKGGHFDVGAGLAVNFAEFANGSDGGHGGIVAD